MSQQGRRSSGGGGGGGGGEKGNNECGPNRGLPSDLFKQFRYGSEDTVVKQDFLNYINSKWGLKDPYGFKDLYKIFKERIVSLDPIQTEIGLTEIGLTDILRQKITLKLLKKYLLDKGVPEPITNLLKCETIYNIGTVPLKVPMKYFYFTTSEVIPNFKQEFRKRQSQNEPQTLKVIEKWRERKPQRKGDDGGVPGHGTYEIMLVILFSQFINKAIQNYGKSCGFPVGFSFDYYYTKLASSSYRTTSELRLMYPSSLHSSQHTSTSGSHTSTSGSSQQGQCTSKKLLNLDNIKKYLNKQGVPESIVTLLNHRITHTGEHIFYFPSIPDVLEAFRSEFEKRNVLFNYFRPPFKILDPKKPKESSPDDFQLLLTQEYANWLKGIGGGGGGGGTQQNRQSSRQGQHTRSSGGGGGGTQQKRRSSRQGQPTRSSGGGGGGGGGGTQQGRRSSRQGQPQQSSSGSRSSRQGQQGYVVVNPLHQSRNA